MYQSTPSSHPHSLPIPTQRDLASTMTVAHTGNWPNWGERRKRNIFLSKASGDVHDKFATAKSSAARDA